MFLGTARHCLFVMSFFVLFFGVQWSDAYAEWVLYDDFSGNEWTDKWQYGSEGSNPDVTWSEDDGVLTVVKSIGITDITKENGNRCRIVPRSFPADVNGFRYDIRIVSFAGESDSDTFRVKGNFADLGGQFDFGRGQESVYRYSMVYTKGYDLASKPTMKYGKFVAIESLDGKNEKELFYAEPFPGGTTPMVWSTISLHHGMKDSCIGQEFEGEDGQYYSQLKIADATETGVSDPYAYLRVDHTTAKAIFVAEIDNVYYHVGDFEPKIGSEVKTVFIPMP